MQRTTTSGQACLLPAVFRGYLFFNCVDYTDAQTGTAEICPTQASRALQPAVYLSQSQTLTWHHLLAGYSFLWFACSGKSSSCNASLVIAGFLLGALLQLRPDGPDAAVQVSLGGATLKQLIAGLTSLVLSFPQHSSTLPFCMPLSLL
jgi:hypothetical protein